MKTVIFLILLTISRYGYSQVSAFYDGIDAIDTYIGERNLRMSTNLVRVQNFFDCTDTAFTKKPVIERIIFNKHGGIDTIIRGQDILNNSISLIQVFVLSVTNQDTILTCINKYISPGTRPDFYNYSYLYNRSGQTLLLKYPKDKEGNLVLTIRYHFQKNGNVRKRVYDMREQLVLDTILTKVKYWNTKTITQNGRVKLSKIDNINGGKMMFHISYFNGRPMEDSAYEINGGKKIFVKRKIFSYNNHDKLIRESILNNSNVLLKEKRMSYTDNSTENYKYEEEDFLDGSLSVYNSDGQVSEIFYGSNPQQARRYFCKYSENGLLLEKGFFYNGKITSKLCIEYEFFKD